MMNPNERSPCGRTLYEGLFF